jgi:poly(A) polymerase
MHREHTTSFEPVIVPRAKHKLSRSGIDPDALKVLYRLNRHGHIAYLVGGGVRDLLLGRQPKDFDISTSAHPNEVKKLFSNCRLIGRRFRLAHIYFKGGKIIEVATFRKLSEFDQDEDGPIRSDNTFGSPGEDAFRRDFTVNALFYNIADFSLIDYVGGLKDLREGVVRCIGDPEVRFEEDPIRMLRGIRFASLLGFELDTESRQLIGEMRHDIWQGATPRILEDLYRMMGRGSSARALEMLNDLGMLEVLFPEIAAHIRSEGIRPYTMVLARLDERFRQKGVTEPYLMVACLLYPWFSWHADNAGDTDHLALARELVSPVGARIQVPRKVQDAVRQMLAAQSRLLGLKTRRYKPRTLLRKSYFADAFELFRLAAADTAEGRELIKEWSELGANVIGKTEGRGRNQKRRPARRRGRGRKPTRTRGPGQDAGKK